MAIENYIFRGAPLSFYFLAGGIFVMKRLFAFLLSLALMLSMMPIVSAESAASKTRSPEIPTDGDVWDGSIEAPTNIVQKDGVNYYEITKCSQLAYVAQTGGNWLNANYILGNNLILNDVVLEGDEEGNLLNDAATLQEWTPIGNFNNYFNGCFLGNNYIISGMYIHSGSDIGLLACLGYEGTIDGINVVNSYISGSFNVGGIVGYNNGGLLRNCNNCSCVISTNGQAGGICGWSSRTSYYGHAIINCSNYGNIFSKGAYAGGIVGHSSRDDVLMCVNYGNIYANCDYIGGIVGFADTYPEILKSVNYGTISGDDYTGGICGQAKSETYLKQCISDCYNAGKVSGTDSVGGILGNSLSCKLANCYNIANVSGNSNVGAIVGYTDSPFGKSEEHYDYYLSDCAESGRGNVQDVRDIVERKSETELKENTNYHNWDFDTIWAISTTLNNGYPYLAWQDVTDIQLTNLTLTQTTLSLGVGDTAYLTVNPQPATATLPTLVWTSSDTSVATVNGNGRITAVSAGAAIITVSGDEVSATCTVTVSTRTSDEYRLGALTLRDADGAELAAIPCGTCLVTIPITKHAEGGNAMVLLASYSVSGQFKGLLYVEVEDVPVGATVKITLPVDNTKGDIAQLKAFTIASFSDPAPLGATVSVPTQ